LLPCAHSLGREASIDPKNADDDALARATRRYLDVVKAALLDEHYLDNEVRIEYLATLPPGMPPDLAALRDPPRQLPVRFERLSLARHAGRSTDEQRNVAYFPYTDMGRAQLEHLQRSLETVRAGGVEGDVAEVGVGRGGGAIFMRAFLAAHEITDVRVWAADPFVGSVPAGEGDANDLVGAMARYRADLNQVRDGFARFGLLDDQVRFLPGAPDDALAGAPVTRLSLVRFGGGVGDALVPALERILPRVAPGGIVIVEGTAAAKVARAVEDVRDRLGITAPLERIDWNSMAWRMDRAARDGGTRGTSDRAPHRAAPVPPAPDPSLDLTVVVVFYNMQREAARTLLSLSRSYQRDVDDLRYEVIAVDNGSAPDQRLGEEFVGSFGPEFRYIDMGDDATPSPTRALNRAAALARGEAIAFMIDGAHVLTPGVLHLGMTALRTYAPAIVAAQQWYLGPGQQGDALHAGYDQAAEDRLFARIRWPVDGYRLFEIGHFIGERDWFDGLVESNCLFVPRHLLEQAGAFDDSFSMPGGGYANLELFERLGSTPGVNVASLLGEGTFHQVHGGTTTNIADAATRRDLVYSFGEHFRDLRGRTLAGITKPVHYVGAMATKAARRTRSRREITLSFDALRDPVGPEGVSEIPVPVADEVKLAAIEAVWDSQGWKQATWLGLPVDRFPADLYVYQELVVQAQPDWIVVLGDDAGLAGRARYLASICDELDHGRVVAVGHLAAEHRVEHPRITHVVGAAEQPAIADQVRAIVGPQPKAAVIVGLGAVERVIGAFELYAPLVPVDSYVVVENTVVNGRPVASSFGPGPHEAVVNILQRHRDFVSDPTLERYTLTFNRNGYLKRLAAP
jgi:cephalosporin hydroxylase